MGDKRLIHSEVELIRIAKSKPAVILYGCGNVGKTIYSGLVHKGIQPFAFAVTSRNGVKEPLFAHEKRDIRLLEADELCAYRDNALILVTTGEKLHGEIGETLKRLEAKHIAFVSDSLYWKIYEKESRIRTRLKFQVHLTEHCNLNCRGCYHFSPLAQEEYLSLESYQADLQRLAVLFNGEMEEILLLGGEPLLHPDIAAMIRTARRYFAVGKIKILSNGLCLFNMPDEFWLACRETGTELWLTKYPISIDYDKIEMTAAKWELRIFWFNTEPVRTLGHQPLDLSGSQDYLENFENCYRANECIMLDHGKLYSCIIPATIRHFNRYFDQNLEVCESDYINIYEVASGRELLEKLVMPTPFCRYCNREDIAIFGEIPWEVSKYKIEEWSV